MRQSDSVIVTVICTVVQGSTHLYRRSDSNIPQDLIVFEGNTIPSISLWYFENLSEGSGFDSPTIALCQYTLYFQERKHTCR